MKKFFTTLFCLLTVLNLAACGGDDDTPAVSGGDDKGQTGGNTSGDDEGSKGDDGKGDTADDAFTLGADISWYSEMAADGRKFYNKSGEERTCPALMKELGLGAVRLRVWVNPENKYCNYCDKADVVAKAVAAKAAGLDVMIDFHYSDWWADPGKQDTPAAWASLDESGLRSAVAEHTTDVLSALKEAGVTPKWVQVGNETRNGMLWSAGRLWTDSGDIQGAWPRYAALCNAGYDAVKAVCPDAAVLIHLNHAYEDNRWWFDKFKAAGGKFDMIALSHYPQADDEKQTWLALNQAAATHIAELGARYGVKVMVAEVGVYQTDVALGVRVLNDFMTRVKATDACAGVFYWEPEVDGTWRSASYEKLGWSDAYTQGAFGTDGKPTAIFDAFVK